MKNLIFLLLIGLTSLAACGLLDKDKPDRPDIPGKIVFSANDSEGRPQIYTMNANGSDLNQLTHLGEGHGAVQPSWSPDGSKIVFSTTLNSTSNGMSLYIMNADGSNMHPMNDREGSPIPTPGDNADWSPDGNKITFDQCVNCQVSTNHAIFGYDMKADSVIQLTELVPGVSNTDPEWSPDGGKIAFVSDRDYPEESGSDLYIMDSDGSNVKRLTNNVFVGSKCWYPDGSKMFFAGFGKDLKVNLYEYSIVKEEFSKLNIDINIVRPIKWSRNGKFLLLVAANPKTMLYIFNHSTNKAERIPFEFKDILGVDWFTNKNKSI